MIKRHKKSVHNFWSLQLLLVQFAFLLSSSLSYIVARLEYSWRILVFSYIWRKESKGGKRKVKEISKKVESIASNG